MTDREELERMLSALGDLTALSERWDTLLGKTQNGPPDGEGDGTIDVDTWYQVRFVCRGLHNILSAQQTLSLEHVKAAALAKLTPAERSALGLT